MNSGTKDCPLDGECLNSLLDAGTPPSGESEHSTHVGIKGGSIVHLGKDDLWS